MTQGRGAFYEAFSSKDARFDGRFFVGITTTGIYCRPVCRARMPKEDHCLFFNTAAEAEKGGFRPCLLCRPELAPGLAVTDAKSALAKQAARYIEENCGDNSSLAELAARLGYTDRHLRRVFAEAYHVSPLEYMRTCRLLLAKNLLTDTGLSVLDVALASGFGSLRRFNDAFQKQYRLPPTGLRKLIKAGQHAGNTVTVALGYRAPYEWGKMLRFLALRAIPGVERVSDSAYIRTARIIGKDGQPIVGWFSVTNRPQVCVLSVTLSDSLLPVLPQVLGRIRNLFDLHCDPHAVAERLLATEGQVPGSFVCGLRVPGCFDPFELCVRAILGQQITVKAAGTLAGRMAKAFGVPVESGQDGLHGAFPAAEDILHLAGRIEDHLGTLGIIAARARAIQALARGIVSGELVFGYGANLAETTGRLLEIPGIGPWTAAYIAMRALGDTDAFPETDLGIRKALGDRKPKEMRDLSEQWRPWRSYATMALWDALHQEGEQ